MSMSKLLMLASRDVPGEAEEELLLALCVVFSLALSVDGSRSRWSAGPRTAPLLSSPSFGLAQPNASMATDESHFWSHSAVCVSVLENWFFDAVPSGNKKEQNSRPLHTVGHMLYRPVWKDYTIFWYARDYKTRCTVSQQRDLRILSISRQSPWNLRVIREYFKARFTVMKAYQKWRFKTYPMLLMRKKWRNVSKNVTAEKGQTIIHECLYVHMVRQDHSTVLW